MTRGRTILILKSKVKVTQPLAPVKLCEQDTDYTVSPRILKLATKDRHGNRKNPIDFFKVRGQRPRSDMGMRKYKASYFLVYGAVFFILLQFFHYDWNIFDFHWFQSKKKEKLTDEMEMGSGKVIGNQGPNSSKKEARTTIPVLKVVPVRKEVKLAPPRPNIDDLYPPPWNKPLDLRIICMVFNRAHSLERLLNSLNTVDYMNAKVLVEVWLDRSRDDGSIDRSTYVTATRFNFLHGDIRVHNHTRHVGIYGQWMGTWKPSPGSKEIAVFLEDDISVSPHLYRWLKNVHAKYDGRKEIAGYSLQGRSMKHNGAPGNLRAPKGQFCMLYKVVGSWGFSPQRENWFKYIEWYKNTSKDLRFSPLVKGILPSHWYQIFIKQGKTESMWTMWHIYYTHIKNEYTLYPSFPNNQGLTINWQESGLHYQKKQTLKKGDPLLTKWDPTYDNLPDNPVKLDYGGNVIS